MTTMKKFIVAKEQNRTANLKSLRLLCDALGTSNEIVTTLENFNADALDAFRNDTVVIYIATIGDYAALLIYRENDEEHYEQICGLFPGEEGPHWERILEAARSFIEKELIWRKINYIIREDCIEKAHVD